MTPIADMIEKMSTEGVPLSIILLAVRTTELAMSNGKSGGIPVDTAAEKRRAYDRERKAEKRNSGGNSGGIPPEHSNALSSLETGSEKKLKRKEEAKPRQSGRNLPDEWRPSDDHYADGETMHRTRSQVDAKAEEMRVWARANGHRAIARKLDWDAAFTGWMRRDWSGNGGANGQRPGFDRTNSGARESGTDAVLTGVARATERRARERSAARSEREPPGSGRSAQDDDLELFGTPAR